MSSVCPEAADAMQHRGKLKMGRLPFWPPLPADRFFGRRRRLLAFPLDDPACRLFARGRQALGVGLVAAGLVPGDEVLVPAYHHGSEVEAIVQSGLVCRFYDTSERLEADPLVLRAAIGPRTRALVITHYLGFPQASRRWRSFCDEHELLLIEDAAQAWLASVDGRPVGSYADLAVFCLYKTLGLPDGAACVARRPPMAPQPGPLGLQLTARRGAGRLRPYLSKSAQLRLGSSSARGPDPIDDFAFSAPRAPSGVSRRLIARIDTTRVAEQRRANFARLLQAHADRVPEAFRELPPGASPMCFPVAASSKRDLIAYLDSVGIDTVDFWSVPHPSLDAEKFPAARRLREQVVGVPVHQCLDDAGLERIAAALERA